MDLKALGEKAGAAAPVIRPTPKLDDTLVVHVDGDMICYECAGNDEVSQGEARQRALNKIEQLRIRTGAHKAIVHITVPGCHKGYRNMIATVKPYQDQRKSKGKPKNHGYIQDWLMSYKGPAFQTKTWNSREADDGIAACAYYACANGGRIAIATADKDMRMLPGLHVDWKSGELVEVPYGAYDVVGAENGKQYGTKWFWLQMLQGDAADNIPGLPEYVTENARGATVTKKLGEKTAEALLAKCKNNDAAFAEVYGLYCEYYEHIGFTYEEADDRFCEQAALLWMRTSAKAEVDNFMRHTGPGCISAGFPAELKVAAGRLVQRVEKLIAEAKALGG